MKCEICHKNEAQTVLHRKKDGADEELYVCRACAEKERVQRQKKSQSTRRVKNMPPTELSLSISGITPNTPPPPQVLEALMKAMNGVVNGFDQIEKSVRSIPPRNEMPCKSVRPEFRIGKYLHLEGLNLIGELDAIHRAMNALEMQLVGVDADGLHAVGHVYTLRYADNPARAERALQELVEQERNARVRLFEEMPRIFGDSLCRALAVMKNCRLLSPGEFFDLLSPIRLATLEDLLDGVSRSDVEKWMLSIDLTSREDKLTPEERDRVDGGRADEMNRRFEDVVLSERAEGKFL